MNREAIDVLDDLSNLLEKQETLINKYQNDRVFIEKMYAGVRGVEVDLERALDFIHQIRELMERKMEIDLNE